MDRKKVENLVREFLIEIGEDINAEGIKATPERVARFYDNILTYDKELKVIRECEYENKQDKYHVTVFENKEGFDEIIFRSCDFMSFCSHHIIPFFGKCYIAYIPDKLILGMNKLDLIVDYFAGRFQVQEKLTHEIANYIQKIIQPKGVMVFISARHLCGESQKDFGIFETTAVKGLFLDKEMEGKVLSRIPIGGE